MIVTMPKSELQDVLGTMCRYANGAAAYLGCVLVEAGEGATFEATNLNECARCSRRAFVDEPGRCMIPAKAASDIVKSLPDGAVTIEGTAGRARISCGSASFSIPAMDQDDFPGLPRVDEDQSVEMPFAEFASMVGTVACFASKNDSRPIMQGVLVEASGGTVRAVATDSYRLACAERDGGGEFRAVLPARFAKSVSSLKASECRLSASSGQVSVRADGDVFVTRSIEGEYPAWERMFPELRAGIAEFGASDISSALRRAVVAGMSKHPCDIAFSGGECSVKVSGGEDGSMEESVLCRTDGIGEFCANSSYMLEAVAACDGDVVEIEHFGAGKPIVVRGGSCRSVVMPVRKQG